MAEDSRDIARKFMDAARTAEQRQRENLSRLVEDLFSPYGAGRRTSRECAPGEVPVGFVRVPATRLVGCRACGQVNRVPVAARTDGKKPACGKCKAALS